MTTQTVAPHKHRRFKLGRIVLYAILIAFSLFYLLPVLLILITSFKQYSDIDLFLE